MNQAEPQDGTKVIGYRKLSDEDTQMMNGFKEISRAFIQMVDSAGQSIQEAHANSSLSDTEFAEVAGQIEWLQEARRAMQKASMYACRAIAKPDDNC